MKKRRGLCRSGSGCCRRISSVTTSPKFFGVGRRSWGVVVTTWNKNILVRKPKGWGTSLFWFYLSIFNDAWVKQKEGLLSGTPKYHDEHVPMYVYLSFHRPCFWEKLSYRLWLNLKNPRMFWTVHGTAAELSATRIVTQLFTCLSNVRYVKKLLSW